MRKLNSEEHPVFYNLLKGFSNDFLSKIDFDSLAIKELEGITYVYNGGYGVDSKGVPRAIILSVSESWYIDAHTNKGSFNHIKAITNKGSFRHFKATTNI